MPGCDFHRIEGVVGQVDGDLGGVGIEIDGNNQQLVAVFAQEGIVAMGIEAGVLAVDIHQVEETTLPHGFFATAYVEYRFIEVAQPLLPGS